MACVGMRAEAVSQPLQLWAKASNSQRQSRAGAAAAARKAVSCMGQTGRESRQDSRGAQRDQGRGVRAGAAGSHPMCVPLSCRTRLSRASLAAAAPLRRPLALCRACGELAPLFVVSRSAGTRGFPWLAVGLRSTIQSSLLRCVLWLPPAAARPPLCGSNAPGC